MLGLGLGLNKLRSSGLSSFLSGAMVWSLNYINKWGETSVELWGLSIKIAQIFTAYVARVTAGGGVVEGEACLGTKLTNLDTIELLDNASLVMIPSGYKEDVVFSQVPTSGAGDLAFTRASDGTRVNSAGLIEVVPRNLIANSQVLNVAYWSKDLTTVIDNNTTAPNGTTTASKLTEAAGTGSHHIHNASGSFTPIVGASYSMSCFVKLPSTAAGRFVQLPFFIAGFGSNAYVNFDLLNGVVGTIGSSITSSSIMVIGDGWYRISASALATATGSSGFQLSLITALTSARTESYTVTAGSEKAIFLYGLQIEAGSATEYFPTTTRLNMPRLTYPIGGGCPSLLLEPQRTNLLTNSDNIALALNVQANTTITSDTAISPDGTQNADNVLFGTSSYRLRVTSISPLTNYTASLFFKNVNFTGAEEFTLNLSDGVFGAITATIIPSNGTATFTRNISGWSSVSGSVINYGNGWYRVSVSGTSIGGGSGWYEIGCNVSKSALIWGAQLEIGTYPTSYIPTVASSVTRLADTALTTFNFGSDFTLFVDFNNNTVGGVNRYIGDFQSSNGSQGMFFIGTNNKFRYLVFYNGAYIAGQNLTVPTTYTVGDRIKGAIVKSGSSYKFFSNGSLIASYTYTAPTTEIINKSYFAQSFVNDNSLNLNQFIGYAPLTDSQAIALTTL